MWGNKNYIQNIPSVSSCDTDGSWYSFVWKLQNSAAFYQKQIENDSPILCCRRTIPTEYIWGGNLFAKKLTWATFQDEVSEYHPAKIRQAAISIGEYHVELTQYHWFIIENKRRKYEIFGHPANKGFCSCGEPTTATWQTRSIYWINTGRSRSHRVAAVRYVHRHRYIGRVTGFQWME